MHSKQRRSRVKETQEKDGSSSEGLDQTVARRSSELNPVLIPDEEIFNDPITPKKIFPLLKGTKNKAGLSIRILSGLVILGRWDRAAAVGEAPNPHQAAYKRGRCCQEQRSQTHRASWSTEVQRGVDGSRKRFKCFSNCSASDRKKQKLQLKRRRKAKMRF